MITPDLIRALVPTLPGERARTVAATLDEAARAAQITTPERVAQFVAQLAHESAGFRYLEEIWGPTAAQTRYEGRRDLGNTQPGDGYRFRGRGWIQLTGRHNYRTYGRLLGLPLEAQPELAARPDTAARIAATYWTQRGLNALADAGDLLGITRRINGGTNGLEERRAYLTRAQTFLTPPAAPRVLLVPQGGGEPVPWDGRPALYGGVPLSDALVENLRLTYPAGASRPGLYMGLRVYHRSSGDLVLERTE